MVGACVVAAVVRSLTAHAPGPTRTLSPAERLEVGRAAAALEPRWRLETVHRFPGDCWSADDDLGASEWTWVREEAGRRGVPVTEIFRAIDQDLHAFPVVPPRKSNACPCKPRPFYG